MPRILRIINRLNLGGPTYNAGYLTKYLEPEFETRLLAGVKDEDEASSEFILKQLDVVPEYIPEMHRSVDILNDRAAYKKIKQIIHDFKPDVVHTHASKAGLLGRVAAHKCRVPVIVHTFHGHVFHSYFNSIKTSVIIKIERFLAKRTHAIIAISDTQKDELVNRYRIAPASKFKVIPLGFDLSRFQQDQELKRKKFRKEFGLNDEDVAVGIIGRVVPIKNHIMFLRMFNRVLKDSTSKVKGFVIGDGSETKKMMIMAKQMGMKIHSGQDYNAEADIYFTSWIMEVDEVLAGLDIVALTSLNEGTPVSLIEAQAAGKPIVTTDAGGISDIVKHKETALISPIDDDAAMAQNLLDLIRNETIFEKMSQSGRINVKDQISFERLVKDTRMLYKELLKIT
ncbi:MAG: glycosyltransferase [Bacteroidetes bacterium]|nr:glycosyltransferase [Bacteroidota bacterium]